ncbi:efflux RND transporter periplasmic adaptor subunit [bacterium]|nr:MAG: efflux RND transporter periplasmic adaptor subunit [bacterium]
MRKIRLALITSTLALALLSGCSSKDSGKDSPAKTEGKPPVAVEILKVSGENTSSGIDVVGTLEQKFSADVKSEVRGRITALHVTQWVNVRKGQPLAEIDASEPRLALERAKAAIEGAKAQEAVARAQAEVAKSQAIGSRSLEETARAGLMGAEVDAERSEREYQRLKNLRESGLATQQSLDEGLSALDAAKARVRAAKSQIESTVSQIASAQAQVAAAEAQARAASAQVAASLEDMKQLETQIAKATIVSPLDGTVSERFMNVGDLPGDAVIMRVVDNSLLNLTVNVPSQAISSVKAGQTLSFSTDSLPGETFEGKVMFINPSADPADRSLRVTAEVRNSPPRLRGGLFVKGRIVTGAKENVILLPRGALVYWDVPSKKGEVFVVTGTTAKKRSVTTGAAGGDTVEIVTGLFAGEAVVLRGGFNLVDGDVVSVSEARGAK